MTRTTTDVAGMLREIGLRVRCVRSLPFPGVAGRIFPHADTVVVADRPGT
jgi:hypothetical protein